MNAVTMYEPDSRKISQKMDPLPLAKTQRREAFLNATAKQEIVKMETSALKTAKPAIGNRRSEHSGKQQSQSLGEAYSQVLTFNALEDSPDDSKNRTSQPRTPRADLAQETQQTSTRNGKARAHEEEQSCKLKSGLIIFACYTGRGMTVLCHGQNRAPRMEVRTGAACLEEDVTARGEA